MLVSGSDGALTMSLTVVGQEWANGVRSGGRTPSRLELCESEGVGRASEVLVALAGKSVTVSPFSGVPLANAEESPFGEVGKSEVGSGES